MDYFFYMLNWDSGFIKRKVYLDAIPLKVNMQFFLGKWCSNLSTANDDFIIFKTEKKYQKENRV